MGILEILIIGFFAGMATALGGFLGAILPVHRNGCMGLIIGFGAGVMIGISLFSIMPQAYYFTGSPCAVGLGFFLGISFMYILGKCIPCGDYNIKKDIVDYKRVGLLMALGIAFHNFPEGVAMGAGFQGGEYLGFVLAFALMLHNIPEGICISAPLRRSGYSVKKVVLISALAGIVTPIGAIIGWILTANSLLYLSIGMGFAAGAMIYISFAQVLKIRSKFLDLGIFLGILLTFFLT